jgi:hypothetical protein
MRIRGLRDRRGVDHRALRQRDRLLRHMPDRKYCAEDEDEISSAFKHAAFFLFRTNEQRVGRFETFGGESILFHIFNWVDDESLCKARATSADRVLSR